MERPLLADAGVVEEEAALEEEKVEDDVVCSRFIDPIIRPRRTIRSEEEEQNRSSNCVTLPLPPLDARDFFITEQPDGGIVVEEDAIADAVEVELDAGLDDLDIVVVVNVVVEMRRSTRLSSQPRVSQSIAPAASPWSSSTPVFVLMSSSSSSSIMLTSREKGGPISTPSPRESLTRVVEELTLSSNIKGEALPEEEVLLF